MLTDLRSALRQITRSPGHTTVVVLTLALGIAVNNQIFSAFSAMFLSPLGVRAPEELVVVAQRSAVFHLPHGLSLPDFLDLRTGSRTLTDLVAAHATAAHLGAPGHNPERGWIEAVTPDAFARHGVAAVQGRTLLPADGDGPGAASVALLTHRYWQNHFGGDPDIVGRTLLINARPFVIVGVAAPGFESFSALQSVALFVPSGALRELRGGDDGLLQSRSASAWRVLGRFRPGATLDQVNAELTLFAERFTRDYPEEHRHVRFQAWPERRARPDPSVADFMPAFIALFFGLVFLVLLIACANVTNLLGARAVERERELVLRAALGASRFQLIRQLLVECLLLALLAGLVGYTLGVWSSGSIEQFIPAGDVPIRRDPPEGWQTSAFTVGLSLLSGLVAGLLPALRASRVDLNEGLKQGSGQHTGSGRHRLRDLLVVGQVAISCLVLVAAALFLRGLQAATRDLQLGFRPERLFIATFDPGLQGYDRARGLRFGRELLERVRGLPGVESAGLTQHLPFSYNIQLRDVWPDNPTGTVPEGHLVVPTAGIDPDYLTMIGTPIRQGRNLGPADREGAPDVAIINEAMARAFWPGRDPVGQHFRLARGGGAIEVVGVTPTGKYVMLSEESKPYFYRPLGQSDPSPLTLVVRATSAPAGVAAAVRGAFRAIDPDLPLGSLNTLEEHMASSIFALLPLRTGALFAAIQGCIGLALSVLGLYAVVAHAVGRRTREIGVRLALGATSVDVLRLVSRTGLRLTLLGLALGFPLASGLALVLSRLLYGVRPFDPAAYLGVLLVLAGTAALACWLPGRRATRVDPMTALRSE